MSEGDLARDARSILQLIEPLPLGLMLDSTAPPSPTERQGKNARQPLEFVAMKAGDDDIALSVITVLELAHGIASADSPERRNRGNRFLDDLLTGIPVQPVTVPVALRAGRIDGQSEAKGVRITLSDLPHRGQCPGARLCGWIRQRSQLSTDPRLKILWL